MFPLNPYYRKHFLSDLNSSHSSFYDRLTQKRKKEQRLRSLLNLCLGFSLALLLCLGSGLGISTTWAWQYEAVTDVYPGQKASISIVSPSDLRNVSISLRSDRSKQVIRNRIKALKAHKGHKVSFKPPTGTSHWWIKVEGQNAQKQAEYVEFELDVMSAKPLAVKFFNDESDLESGRLVFSSSRPLDRIEVEAFGDQGESQWSDKLALISKANQKLEAQFSAREEVPRRLEIKAFDSAGAWMGFRVVRWYAEVPHQDVLFQSGSSQLNSVERPKLEEARDLINEEIKRFQKAMGDEGATVDLQLYVAGYTDSVGDQADNRKLSAARALTLSKAFRELGLTLPIFYAGFGEDAPIVKTPDSTDEPRNRRANYIVSNSRPQGIMFPSAQWRTLK